MGIALAEELAGRGAEVLQGSFDAHFQNGFQEGDFNMHQLRIEAKGNINNWLSYRYRQRLNRSNDGNNMIDNLPTSIDWAGIGIAMSMFMHINIREV